jgi:hypothetical protein
MPQRRALTIELAAQRWCLLRYCRFLCDRPVTGAKITRLQNYCRDAMKIDRYHGVEIEQTGPLGERVQCWLHPRGAKSPLCAASASASAVRSARRTARETVERETLNNSPISRAVERAVQESPTLWRSYRWLSFGRPARRSDLLSSGHDEAGEKCDLAAESLRVD